MKIDIKHIAKLSRLKIEDSRLEKFETNKFKREELLSNAPEVQAGCLVVPKTVE